jgi:nucleoside-diphosphate-sugar epimerase
MSRTIALTGATGFIGGALARRLETIGWPASFNARYVGTATQWIEGDLGDPNSLRRLVNDVYAVVHCAGAVRGASRAQFDGVNVDGVARLVQAAREQHQMPRFLLISSLAAREPHLSPYAASKRRGEEILASAAGDMNWTVLRPSAVYGPGDKELLPLFRWIGRGIAPILGSRGARFSLLYVEDLAEAMVQWLNSETNERRAFELHDGHPEGYAWHDVIDTIARLYDRHVFRIQVPVSILRLLAGLNLGAAQIFGYAPMFTPGKVRELSHLNWVCDNDALAREIGWTPRISLAEGLQRTLRLGG